ncbi:MAG TPA: DNA mismatch repair endonuclease MutL [Candidatus Diapherotrites archaeon]|nr:DNA mismatch repair endonuclease MutL [Candidatus Diapherotrites archaeon]
MKTIKKLNQETINLISAGEVIESPSDILKELLENSIDANATEITVKIRNSGVDLLEIKDNGTGISEDDLKICTQRHTTSKLENIDDIYNLDTFGFRGEALASINAISKLEITSADNLNGKGYILKEGNTFSVACPKGTTIKVEDIFYNVPVRKKFLKSKAQEFSKLYNTFLEFVIQYPNIRFHFNSEKKDEIFSSTTQDKRYEQIFGKDILTKVEKIDAKNEFLKIKGIITKPSNYFFYPNNYLYINKRAVYSTSISKLIQKCYKDYLMVQQKPFFVLFIELDSKTLDVNVHPKKRLVKIQNEFIFNLKLKEIIENTLFPKSDHEQKPASTSQNLHYFLDDKETEKSTNILKSEIPEIIYQLRDNNVQSILSPPVSNIKKICLSNHEIREIIGQLFETFIVCRTPEGLLLIDQHAAEERINLEKNRRLYESEFKVQSLVIPKTLDFISESQKEFIKQNKSLLLSLGFTIESKDNTFILTTIPEFLEHYFDHTFFLNILNEIEDTKNFDLSRIKEKILKLKSCKESIKANEQLSISKIYQLIERLDQCKDKGICAHGRPTYLLLNRKELEKMFKRV